MAEPLQKAIDLHRASIMSSTFEQIDTLRASWPASAMLNDYSRCDWPR